MKKSVFGVIFFMAAVAFANAPVLQQVEVATGFIPHGFDDNDNVQVTVEGAFPDSCYKVGPTRVNVVGETIQVIQMAYKYSGACLDVMVPFYQTVELGIMPEGRYTLVDGYNGKTLGDLPIAKSKTASADDYLYAPVSDANIENNQVVIKGAFTNSCLAFQRIMVRNIGNVIEVLPIIEKFSGPKCEKGYFPFKRRSNLPGSFHGHYLLHVRSLEGKAINKIIDL